jgi:pimeloyl-ACP methyl ester carboxylesterase
MVGTGPRRRRWLKAAAALVTFLGLAVGGTMVATHDPSPVGHWRTEEGRQAFATSYAAAMRLLPEPTRTLDLRTDYGTVRVYEFVTSATRSRTPVVLLPGRTASAPMWLDNLSDLAAERPVYAPDTLGDAGMSVQTRELVDGADQAAWLDQVLARVLEEADAPRIHLVGHSFGGWSAANYATRHPERLASLTLVDPVFVFQGIRWPIYVKSIPASVPFLPRSWRDRLLGDIGGGGELDLDDPLARLISDGMEHYAGKLPLPERLDEEQLQGLGVPVYAAMAAESALHDSAAAVEVGRARVRDIRIRSWPGATHSLPMEFPGELDREMLHFMAEHE